MPKQSDVREISAQGDVRRKRRFDVRDWAYIADYVNEEYLTRKNARRDRERQWADIDRQISMQPELKYKKMPDGKADVTKQWMAEMELPLQAQAQEVLTADARRLLFGGDPWFVAHSEMTDTYLQRVDLQSIILGDKNEIPSVIDQDDVDKLVHGFLMHIFRQNDFYSRVDKINAEVFKYAMGVGRARMETKNIFIHESKGVRKERQKLPVLVPCSIKNLYLDNPMPSMHSAQVLGPAHIAYDRIRYENLMLAANRGSTDPDDPDGGWMPANLRSIEPDNDGYVTVLEMEGDIVIPRKTTRSMVIPGAIVTVASGDKASRNTIRFRFRDTPYSSYLLFPYHFECVDDPYPTSPLMKGRPIQIMATDCLNRMLDSGALKNHPPIGYDRTDQTFAKTGGPEIFPGAQWPSSDPGSIKAHTEIGGDQSVLAAALSMAINFYAELTGVLPARLGAQTKSHTTAFAKGQEIERGAVRTVDYVNQVGEGVIPRWLEMAYDMGRNSIGRGTISFFIKAYGGFVEVGKDQLPEKSIFEWLGSSGTQDEATKLQRKIQSAQMAIQIDLLRAQLGMAPTVNTENVQREILREGGWLDLDTITQTHQATANPNQFSPGLAIAASQGLGNEQQ